MAITRRAPEVSADQNSHTDRSNVATVLSSTASSGPRSNASRFHSIWLTTAECGTATPLGRPVDPDVKITYAVFAARSGARRSAAVTGASGSPDRSTRSSSTTGTPGTSNRSAATVTTQVGAAVSRM
ncbi:hypothetical protein AIIKEEIJ_02572 [Rhodococcus sp. YH1]|nr:hypothetical protein [Rhodococcus sp. YH1]